MAIRLDTLAVFLVVSAGCLTAYHMSQRRDVLEEEKAEEMELAQLGPPRRGDTIDDDEERVGMLTGEAGREEDEAGQRGPALLRELGEGG